MATIHLDDKEKAFIDRQIEHGVYRDADEVVKAGLRLLESKEGQLAELRRMIDEADGEIAKGQGIFFSDEQSLADYIIEKAPKHK